MSPNAQAAVNEFLANNSEDVFELLTALSLTDHEYADHAAELVAQLEERRRIRSLAQYVADECSNEPEVWYCGGLDS